MIDPTVIDALVDSGCTVQQLAAAVKADAAMEKEKLLERRYQATIRKRNQRSRHRDIVGQRVTSPLPPCPPSPSDKEKVPTPLKEINSLSPLNPPSPQNNLVRFDEFWPLYPRKQAKADAQKAWQQALKAGISPDTMVNGLRNHCFSDDPAFHPLPASWIRGRRWEDQSAPVMPLLRPKTRREDLLDRLKAFADSPDEDQPEVRRQLGSPNGSAVPADPNGHGTIFDYLGKPLN
jgi:hypothetical protein